MKQEQYTKKSNKTKKKESVSAKNFEAKRIHDIKKKKKNTKKYNEVYFYMLFGQYYCIIFINIWSRRIPLFLLLIWIYFLWIYDL